MTGVTIFSKTSDQAGKEVWGDELSVLFTVVTVGERYLSVYFLTHLLLPALIFSHRKCYKQKHLQWRCGVKDDRSCFVTKEFSVEKQLPFSDVTRQACILSFWNWSRRIKCKTIHRKIAKNPNVILSLRFLKSRRYYVHLKEDLKKKKICFDQLMIIDRFQYWAIQRFYLHLETWQLIEQCVFAQVF